MCPLLWCRTSFNDVAAVAEHLSSCPWLSDGLYWCPFCRRPERFTPTEATSTAIPHAVDLGQETKFQRAVAFFKNLRYRKNGRSRSSLSPGVGNYIEYLNGNADTSDQRYELEVGTPAELDSRKIHELGDESPCVTPGSSTANLSLYTPSTDTQLSWEDERHAAPSPYPPPITAYGKRTDGADAQPGVSRPSVGMHDSGYQALSSPICLTRDSRLQFENNAGKSSIDLCQLQSPTTNPPSSQSTQRLPSNGQYCIANILSSTSSFSSNPPPPVYEAEEGPSRKEPAMTKVLTGDLYDAVRAMNEEWIRRLALNTNIPQPNHKGYTRALFKLGITALINYFRGVMPNTFQDILAFTHVAIASCYMVHKDDDGHLWDAILEEACQWQGLLSDVIEKATFVKVMSQLYHPRGSTTSPSLKGSAVNDCFLPAENARLVHLLNHLSALSTDFDETMQIEADKSRRGSTTDIERTGLPGIWRSDVVIKGCMGFLDSQSPCHLVYENDCSNIPQIVFSYALHVARRQNYSEWYMEQHRPSFEELDSNIVARLQGIVGLEAFHGVVADTRDMLRRGLLHSARDVEIMLVGLGKVSQVLSFWHQPSLIDVSHIPNLPDYCKDT